MLKGFLALSILASVLGLAACQSVPPDTPKTTVTANNLVKLRQSGWVLTHVGNTAVPNLQEPRQMAHLQFNDDARVFGADGCNRVAGSYRAGADTLNFEQMITTRMACLNNNQLDVAFNSAITHVTHYQVYADTLKLLDRYGNVLLQFKAIAKSRLA